MAQVMRCADINRTLPTVHYDAICNSFERPILKRATSARRFFAGGVLYALAASAGAAPNYVDPDFKATRDIKRFVAVGNCGNAIEALKSGLKAKQPDVLLLAGTLYEEGMCVSSNWERAVSLYMLADQAGNKSAIPRLIAGHAMAGRDNGLALWWAAKSRLRDQFPVKCIPGSDPDANPDGFNQELERMPPKLFQACVYALGVVGEVYSDAQYPSIALYHGISGTVKMEFNPSQGTINWQQEELIVSDSQPYAVQDLAKVELANPRAIKNSLLAYLKSKGEFALSRYKKPDAYIDPEFVFKGMFAFDVILP